MVPAVAFSYGLRRHLGKDDPLNRADDQDPIEQPDVFEPVQRRHLRRQARRKLAHQHRNRQHSTD